ncbi:hypothetical protein OKA04_20555 [Luteolibacter flavescens]|uniref:Cytochrome c7-like domain-containing protein n=1 Tax=Luteolibacter flavescens TaxID=1859460 RepID=A0ABT3FU84_9BACT|nr:hypothetical protein [Luteolibacter flavescens]MCW1887142.1 hypothetical protein [Luteolibacter flavescens]
MAPSRETSSPIASGRKRRRKLVAIIILGLIAWRAWPVASALTGWNTRGAVVYTPLSEYFLPPAQKPDEIRSGMAHPGFAPLMFSAQVIFCPRAVRHGHAFWCNDPALSDAQAGQLAEILASADTYEPWLGHKGCGGFHADWYVRWGEGAERHEVIICEGCHEALAYHGGGFIRCDICTSESKPWSIRRRERASDPALPTSAMPGHPSARAIGPGYGRGDKGGLKGRDRSWVIHR